MNSFFSEVIPNTYPTTCPKQSHLWRPTSFRHSWAVPMFTQTFVSSVCTTVLMHDVLRTCDLFQYITSFWEFIYILMRCVMEECSNAFNSFTVCNGSNRLTNSFKAFCLLHHPHSSSSKHVTQNFQHSNSLVGFITLTYPAYLAIV
jgi:hypothetical protein